MARSNTSLVETTQPQLAPYGILSPATTVVEDSSYTWLNEFSYEVGDSGVHIVNQVINGGPADGNHTVIDNSANQKNFRTYYPFDVTASIKHSTFGTDPERLLESAKHALDIVTQKAVEAEFWHGSIAQQLTRANDNRYLASTQAIDVTPGGVAVKSRYGLALLEEALGESTIGSQGVIHAPKILASVLKTDDEDGMLVTALDTPVVSGSGYSYVGPDGTAAPAGKAWMYATGPVTVRLGNVNITTDKLNQVVDTRINDITYYVDRPAAVTWSTTDLFAVLVDLTLDYI